MFSFWVFSCVLFYFGYKISERNKLALTELHILQRPATWTTNGNSLIGLQSRAVQLVLEQSFMKTCGHNILFLLTCKYDLCTIMKKNPPPKKAFFLVPLHPFIFLGGGFLCVFVKKNVAFEQQSSENAVKHKNLTFLKMSPTHTHLISSSYNFFECIDSCETSLLHSTEMNLRSS